MIKMFTQDAIEDIYPLSPMQEGMFFHYEMNRESTVYIEQEDISVKGTIDIGLFEKSFNVLIAHHAVLRTVFTSKKLKKPRQVVLKKRSAGVYFEDISGLAENEKSRWFETFKDEDRKKGFNLSRDILMRISVIKTSADSYRLLLTFYHIILDGWSVGILYRDLLTVYRALRLGKPFTLEPVKEYKHYIKWLEKQSVEKGLQYWENYLEGYEQVTSLPRIYHTPADGQFERCKYQLVIDEDLTGKLTNFARENQVTLNTLFQVLWAILLKRYNHTNDVLFGTIVSGRPMEIQDISRMVGLFINNVPFRVRLNDDVRFSQLVREVQERDLVSKAYEYLPLAQIQAQSALKRFLTDHIMVFENYPIQNEVRRIGLEEVGFRVEDMELWGHTNYDFVILVAPGKTTTVLLKYNALVYPERLVEDIAGHLQELIDRVMADTQLSIGALGKMNPGKQEEILRHFNRDLERESDFLPQPKTQQTLQGQLAEIFQKYGTNTAVEYGSRVMTYAELEKKSAAIARWITANGIDKETFIGILLDDRLDVIVSIIGILRARCVFVPFYQSYPVEQIEAMSQANHIQYIIMDKTNYGRFEERGIFSGGDTAVLFLQDMLNSPARIGEIGEMQYNPDDRIYLYFTSGTTGTPKGVVGKNVGLLHFIHWEIGAFNIDSHCRTSQFTIPTFDPYLRDIFVPLLAGGTVCIPPDKDMILNAGLLGRFINEERITLIHCVTSLFRLLNTVSLTAGDFPALQTIALGGEKTNPADLAAWYKTFGERIQLVNFYGPTETTLVKIHYFIRENDVNRVRIPIGRPITGAGVIILDEKLGICAPLEAGEICIRTPYRSHGYYNDPEGNRKKFIVNPFNNDPHNDPNDIIYRSGDLGRYLPDGTIDILGRIDRQVKIRGHRIELEGIEQVLTNHPLVKEAALIKKEMANNIEILLAFIVKKKNAGAESENESQNKTNTGKLADDIKGYLAAKLPDYMVPAQVLEIEKMPRKANGKIDFLKLPEFSGEDLMDETDNSAPRDLIEKRLSALWTEVLGLENIGITRRFFDIGGNSLNMMSLSAKIYKEFDIKIPLPELFIHTTMAQQAGIIRESMRHDAYKAITKAEEKTFYPVTPAQNRLYMVQQLEPGSTAYNLPHSFILVGDLDVRRLGETFKKLVQRHESLRTSFELVDGEVMQRVHSGVDIIIENHDVRTGNFVRPFDLARAPLLRVGLAPEGTTGGRYILAIDVHHIVTDGVSLVILVKEFMNLYEGRQLPALDLQYRDYSEWQNSPGQAKFRKNQESYWLQEFAGFADLEPLNLRPDYERPKVMSYEGDALIFQIAQEKVAALKALTLAQGATMFTTLLAVYVIMLAKISVQNDFVIGTLAAGRVHADLENMIGMFVNTLALRCRYDGEKTFTRFLAGLNKKSLEAFENQDYPFEDLVRQVVDGRDQSRNPLFDTMFVLQNVGMKELKLPGLTLLPCEIENRVAKFDISLKCVEAGDNYFFHLEYRTKLFKKEKIARYAGYFKQIIDMIVENVGENKDLKLAEIEIAHEFASAEIPDVKLDFDF